MAQLPCSQARLASTELTACILAAQCGSRQAYATLIANFYRDIERYLRVRTRDPDLASDLTQDTFVAALERIEQLRDPQAFAAWLYQIARNQWRMWVRRRTQKRLLSIDGLAEPPYSPQRLASSGDAIEQLPEIELVHQAFARLAPKLQDALYLRHLAGFSDGEIASILGISPAAAQKRAYRATVAFRKLYDQLDTLAMEDTREETERLPTALMSISPLKT